MTHLNIQQGSDVEIVSAQIIKKLYDTALTVSEPLEGETDAAYMSGNLLSNKASRKACTYLTTRFPNLHITALEYYIDFEDDVLGNRLISLFSSDGVGVTEADAANATINSTDISDLANSVTSFDEFKYFTKANGNTGNASCRFKDFVNLTSIDLSNLQYLRSCDFLNTAITTVNLESLVGTVSGYGASAFENCTSLTTIQSFGTINYTPKNCFKRCTSLTTLPNNFFNNITVDFNEGTFYNCTNLVINNPTIKATYIAKNAFANTKLSGTLNCENLTSIGDTAFQNTNLTQVQCLGYIPSVKGFDRCTSLTTVYIPWDAEEITGFNGCSSLTTLRLYDKQLPYVEGETPVFNEISRIKRFGRDCFKNCTGLTNTIDLTDVTYLGLDCFNGAYNLNFIGSTSNIQHWGLDNFLCSTSNRIDLSNVTIVLNSNPDLSNYSSTFYGCKMPSTVTFGEDVTFISSQCFSNTIGLLTVTQTVTDPNKTGITAIDSYAFSKSTIQSVPYTNVQTIGLEAFLECTNLTTINFPSLTSLTGNNTFLNCTNLTTINFPSLTSLTGNNTFLNCTNLTTVTSLGSITSIPTNTFRNCTSLSSINIPSTVTSYGESAFRDCTSLYTTIDLTGVTNIRVEPFVGSNVSFTGNTSSITTLGNGAFKNSRISGNLSFPSLTSIGSQVFLGCSSMLSIDLTGSTITSIPYNTFKDCTSLAKITIPTTVTNLGEFWLLGVPGPLTLEGFDNVSSHSTYNYTIDNKTITNPVKVSYSDDDSTLLRVTNSNNNASINQLYEPLRTSTKNGFLQTNGTNNTMYTYNATESSIISFGLLYYRDIISFGNKTFYRCTIDNLVINNVTPPTFTPNSDESSSIWIDKIFPTGNSTASDNVVIGTLWVPDSAVATYQANPLYSHLNIKGINTKTNSVDYDLPRYATYVAWKTAEEAAIAQGGHAPTGLIEEWM